MTTPDAYPVDEHVLEHLVNPIMHGESSISYARQLPHDGADIFESFPRDFNYPHESQLRSIKDVDKYGVYTFFNSDSCAAYSNSALDEIGGIPSVLVAEDNFIAVRLLKKGHKIAYRADAEVQHSHRYTLAQEFYRSFDTGYARYKDRSIIDAAGPDEKRGVAFLASLLKKVGKEKPFLLPYAVLQTAVKWFGYRIGASSVHSPLWWKKLLSSKIFTGSRMTI